MEECIEKIEIQILKETKRDGRIMWGCEYTYNGEGKDGRILLTHSTANATVDHMKGVKKRITVSEEKKRASVLNRNVDHRQEPLYSSRKHMFASSLSLRRLNCYLLYVCGILLRRSCSRCLLDDSCRNVERRNRYCVEGKDIIDTGSMSIAGC